MNLSSKFMRPLETAVATASFIEDGANRDLKSSHEIGLKAFTHFQISPVSLISKKFHLCAQESCCFRKNLVCCKVAKDK